ncbi:UNC93-like protein 3 [Aristolochia californica]|uniref:UNC93-like protein 3 n=1 Tax=Aristolochia californica TaxID=171875 RepID=UPI0035E0E93E
MTIFAPVKLFTPEESDRDICSGFSKVCIHCRATASNSGGMESVDAREEEALLVPGNSPRSHERDVHILSFAFLFIFSAYGAVQNLESTANKEKDLGTTSMGILYLSFTFFSLVASSMVRVLGLKKSLVLGTTGYWIFIASHLKPTLYTMVPASVYLGFAASIIWVGQGTYLTSVARSHASDCNLHEGAVIGRFNGEFWGIFASTQVIGNLVSLALLRGEKGGTFGGKTLLYTVFLASVTVGIMLMFSLRKRDAKTDDLPPSSTNFYATLGSLLKLVISPLCDKRMLLILPLLAYSGLQQAFVWSEFNKYVVEPALGVPGVGGVMAVYGFADVICSVVAGRFTSDLSSITLIVSGGAFLQLLVLPSLLLKYSMTSGVLRYIFPLLVAVIWGIGDGVFNTQLNATLGMLFKHDTEAAFAQLKVWQSAATSVVFFASPYITFEAMVVFMIAAVCISVGSFLYLTLKLERAFGS